jgi:hypothetical protein
MIRGTRRFITVFTRALHWSLSSARWIQCISHLISPNTHPSIILPHKHRSSQWCNSFWLYHLKLTRIPILAMGATSLAISTPWLDPYNIWGLYKHFYYVQQPYSNLKEESVERKTQKISCFGGLYRLYPQGRGIIQVKKQVLVYICFMLVFCTFTVGSNAHSLPRVNRWACILDDGRRPKHVVHNYRVLLSIRKLYNWTCIHASSRIRTRDPSVLAGDDISGFRPHGNHNHLLYGNNPRIYYTYCFIPFGLWQVNLMVYKLGFLH